MLHQWDESEFLAIQFVGVRFDRASVHECFGVLIRRVVQVYEPVRIETIDKIDGTFTVKPAPGNSGDGMRTLKIQTLRSYFPYIGAGTLIEYPDLRVFVIGHEQGPLVIGHMYGTDQRVRKVDTMQVGRFISDDPHLTVMVVVHRISGMGVQSLSNECFVVVFQHAFIEGVGDCAGVVIIFRHR
jgi:hypothetical protein